MKKSNKILIFGILGLILFSSLWFNSCFIKDNASNFKEKLFQAGQESDVIIVFNGGGWGTISFENALDFNPIINEIKNKIESKDYKVSVVEYQRTKESLVGKIGSINEIIFNFPKNSEVFAKTINEFLKDNPDNKIIVAGLSNGATFVNSAMEELNQKKDKVFSIELGAPFWENKIEGENILKIINDNDALANGNIGELFFSLIKTPFIWAYGNIKGDSTSFSEAMNISGHNYYWQEIEDEIISFIEKNFSKE
ncbi:MAG: hypothetical protein PHU17_00805 [Candidatus Pacebacteria bacterium]|nr:hypothetical protein [Candidatus Paceibacterota bacterium]MDD4074058.1 hypothetical protein [Candidatus Paceibacterota bacterium]